MSAGGNKRVVAFLVLAAALAGCTTSGQSPSAQGLAAAPTVSVDPRDCPRIGTPEDMAVMRKGTAPDYEYIVSVSEVTRSCRIEGGQVYMDVGIAGRIVPGPATNGGTVTVPLQVIVKGTGGQVYSKNGAVSVAIAPGGPSNFTYVDRGITVSGGSKLLVSAGIARK